VQPPIFMAITVTKSHLHWNYFVALERDLSEVSRYVEFCTDNLQVFSIELAHLLLSASSEVDVMAKCLCKLVVPQARPGSVDEYRNVLMGAVQNNAITDLSKLNVKVPRYGMSFTPWENWAANKTPDWWRSYNNVKHERNLHFDEATLQHTLNAVGALFVINYLFYRLELNLVQKNLGPYVVFKYLNPSPCLMSLQ
jgi:hypothetical protein